MPNSKLLIELEGVEAGSRECGECRHMYQVEDGPVFSYCTNEEFAVDRDVLLSTSPESVLRCPACLASEVKVPESPTLADLGYHILRKLGFDGLYLGKTCSCGEKGNLMDKCSADLSYPPKCRAGYRQPDGTIGPKKEG